MARDPVCGMTVDPAKAAAQGEHNGQTYFFCCKGCAQKFSANPEKYLRPVPLISTIAAAAVTSIQAVPIASTAIPSPATSEQIHYTCPMDP